MKKQNISDDRFIIEWMSTAEGKKFAEVVTRMSGVARKSHKDKHATEKASV